MAHKVRVVQHAAFLKRDEHHWLRAPPLHTESSVYMSRRALCQNETNKPHYQSGEKCFFFPFLICMEDSLITIIRRTLMRQLQTTDESSLMSCTQKKKKEGISGKKKKKKAAITVSLN